LALLHFYVWLPFAAGENGNVPKCAAGCVGFSIGVCTVLASRGLVAYNDLRLKEVGAFEVQNFFWKPHFKCKTNFH
jgi:hypothetical protein